MSSNIGINRSSRENPTTLLTLGLLELCHLCNADYAVSKSRQRDRDAKIAELAKAKKKLDESVGFLVDHSPLSIASLKNRNYKNRQYTHGNFGYDIRGFLGQGVTSEVVFALQIPGIQPAAAAVPVRESKKVAIKLPKKPHGLNREFELYQTLQKPGKRPCANLVKLETRLPGPQPGLEPLVYEFRGMNLFNITEPFSLLSIATMLYQIKNALVFLQKHRIDHLDIKSENVYTIPGTEQYFLGDLGGSLTYDENVVQGKAYSIFARPMEGYTNPNSIDFTSEMFALYTIAADTIRPNPHGSLFMTPYLPDTHLGKIRHVQHLKHEFGLPSLKEAQAASEQPVVYFKIEKGQIVEAFPSSKPVDFQSWATRLRQDPRDLEPFIRCMKGVFQNKDKRWSKYRIEIETDRLYAHYRFHEAKQAAAESH